MRAKLVLALGLIVVLAGCSGKVRGNPDPASSTPAAASPSADVPAGVPKVAHPIDTARFEKEPCAALTAGQLAQLRITTAPKPDAGNKLGPGCEWNAYDEIGLTVGAALLTAGSSLATLYKQNEQGDWKLFKPVADVAGYPGVLLDELDAQPKGNCGLSVAVRDNLIYSLSVTISSGSKDYGNPCPVAQKAAELAVSTMKAG